MDMLVNIFYFWLYIPIYFFDNFEIFKETAYMVEQTIGLNFLIFALPFVSGIIAFFINKNFIRKLFLVFVSISELFVISAAMRCGHLQNYPNYTGLSQPDLFESYFQTDSYFHVALLLIVTSFIFIMVSLYNIGYYKTSKEHSEKDHLLFTTEPEKIFDGFLLLFFSSMALVIISNHIGLSWVGVEATTLFSAPLIYYHMDKKSLEAVWKYLIICSVGIALALVGTFFIYAGLKSDYAFFSKEIDFRWFKIGFIFAFIGYATKAGIVPMHTWLVDAHSQAPSHISALLSGTLLNCALITLYKLSNPYINSDASFVYDIFLFFGSLSVITPAILSLNQKEFKRLLAYSSIENMGVSLIIMGLNKYSQDTIFIEALLVFNLVSHSLSKVFLFLTSGIIITEYAEKRMDKISLVNNPVLKWMWFFGLILILGIPPSGLLITKMVSFNMAIKNNIYIFFVLILSFILMGWSFSRSFIDMCFKDSQIKPINRAPVSMYITSILTGIYAATMMFLFYNFIDL